MAKQIIGIGSVPNDGNGDPLRTAFSKVNDNFNEMYSSFDMSGKLTVGNSTVNSSVSNTSGFRTGNSTFITVANSTTIQIANSSGTANLTPTALNVGANVSVGLSSILVGNSTVNTFSNSSLVKIANSTSTANLNPIGLAVGTSVVNSTGFAAGANVLIGTTGITIGNSSVNVVITSSGFSGNISLGNLVVTGNLTVNGTVTTVNTATLDVADLNITIAKNATTEALANGAGLTIAGANATIQYISDSNNIVFSHKVEIGNSSSNGTINATNYTGTSNNALYLGGTAAANYAANLGLIANSTGTHVKANSGIVVNASGTFINANNGITANSTGTFVAQGTGVVVNATGVHVNSSYIAALDANNASYLGTVAAASYIQNTDSRTLSGNLYFTGTNNVFGANTVKIGTSTIAANGYTYLPNGLKMNWGIVSANSSDGNISFTSAFSTAVYSVTVSGTNTEVTTIPAVVNANTTAALIRTSNATSVNVYFTAIGS